MEVLKDGPQIIELNAENTQEMMKFAAVSLLPMEFPLDPKWKDQIEEEAVETPPSSAGQYVTRVGEAGSTGQFIVNAERPILLS